MQNGLGVIYQINGRIYLNKNLPELGQDLLNNAVWMQDGASPHRARDVMDLLRLTFGSRLLALNSKEGEDWAPSSPDLTPMDVFVFPYLNSLVYNPLPMTLKK